MKRFGMLNLIVGLSAGLASAANAGTIFVDFNDQAAGGAGTETYNVIATPPNPTNNLDNPLATTGVTVNGLVDTTNAVTGVNLLVNSYNTEDGVRAANGATGQGSGLTHDLAPAGINDSAAFDSFWMNNHNSASGDSGWIVTFTGLTGTAYDLSVLSGSTTHTGTWSVTTGTGDSDVVAYGQNTGANTYSDVQSWTNVAPVAGEITLTSLHTTNGSTFRNTYIAFASISEVPEPSSLALLGLGGLVLLRRRR